MKKHTCRTCIFGLDCPKANGCCEYYAPVDEDRAIEEYIEEGRDEYRDAWEEYVAEDRVPFLF